MRTKRETRENSKMKVAKCSTRETPEPKESRKPKEATSGPRQDDKRTRKCIAGKAETGKHKDKRQVNNQHENKWAIIPADEPELHIIARMDPNNKGKRQRVKTV